MFDLIRRLFGVKDKKDNIAVLSIPESVIPVVQTPIAITPDIYKGMFEVRKDLYKRHTEELILTISKSLDGVVAYLHSVGDMQQTDRIVWEQISMIQGTQYTFVYIVASILRNVEENGKLIPIELPVRVALPVEVVLDSDPQKTINHLVQHDNSTKDIQQKLLSTITNNIEQSVQPQFELDKLTQEQKNSLVIDNQGTTTQRKLN